MPVEVVTSSTVTNNAILLGLAALQAWALWWQRRNQKANDQKLGEVSEKQSRVYQLVNKPHGEALSKLAEALERIARSSRLDDDIIAAVNARNASNAHNTNQALADSENERVAANKKAIIAKFLEDGIKDP